MNAGWSRVRTGLVFALALCSLQVGARASAQQTAAPAGEDDLRAQAKQRFEQAVADYDAERYEQALANFQEAFRLRPHPLVNVNIANCYDKLNKPLQAIFHFERFTESDAGTAEQRREVNSALERLRKQVGQLLLRITPDGATVLIDQGEQRRAPILEPIRLEAGEHALQVRLPGYKPVHRSVTVAGGTTFELNIALEPEQPGGPPVLSVTPAPAETAAASSEAPAPEVAPQPSAAPAAVTGADDGGSSPSTGIWIAGAVTCVLGISGIVTGALALSAESDFEEKKRAFDESINEPPLERIALHNSARDDADRADALALTTDLLLGSAVVGAAVTAYLLFSEPGDSEHASARLAPALSTHGGGVQLLAAF